MIFTTNKYTRPVLLSEVSKLNASSFTSFKTFANALSPRAGSRSAKIYAIRSLVSSRKLNSLFINSGNIDTKKSIIALLKNA